MKNIREMFNISYFDNKELSLKEHCDIYSNIKKELISILNKYDIKYVLAETEVIKDLSKENQELKKQLEELDKKLFFTKNELEMRQKSIDNKLNHKQLKDLVKIEKSFIEIKNQQKEFIEWLEDESKEIYRDGGLRQNIFRQILQKYEEIIGDDK